MRKARRELAASLAAAFLRRLAASLRFAFALLGACGSFVLTAAPALRHRLVVVLLALTALGVAVALGAWRVVARHLVGFLVERVGVGMGSLVFKVEDSGRVDGVAHITGFEVEVRACGAAGVAAEGDRVAGFDHLVGLNEEAGEMAIDGFEAVGVSEHDVVAVAAALESRQAHLAVECGAHGIAHPQVEVHTLMHAPKPRAVAIGRIDAAGHRHVIFAHVDDGRLRHVGVAVAVYILAFPTLFIDVELGFLLKAIEVVDIFLGGVNFDLLLYVGLRGKQIGMHISAARHRLQILRRDDCHSTECKR